MESEVLSIQNLSASLQPMWKVGKIPSKRVFDVLFSLGILVIFSPLFVSIALAVKLTSAGGAMYVQHRLGKGGKIFKCYKFRTMYCNAEKYLPMLLARHPHLDHEWARYQKLHDDPRISPIGKWLRRTSLDELPQFWNVLRGDLSVVGPRPYMVCQRRQIGSRASFILSVRPGITGLWQTSGRNKTTFTKRLELDAVYVRQRTFWFDMKLILKTIPRVLFCTDAY
jgi:exopolysaccharide production protein ExoY